MIVREAVVGSLNDRFEHLCRCTARVHPFCLLVILQKIAGAQKPQVTLAKTARSSVASDPGLVNSTWRA